MEILLSYYNEDKLEMAFTAPEFSPTAALWGAQYFYTAVQLTVIRELDEQQVKERLMAYPEPITPEVIYSADLIFRYLPDLFELVKGLAPSDMLVRELSATAAAWPFSSVGIPLKEHGQEEMIFAHPSLKIRYADTIVRKRDRHRLTTNAVLTSIYEVTGTHLSIFWPNFEHSLK